MDEKELRCLWEDDCPYKGRIRCKKCYYLTIVDSDGIIQKSLEEYIEEVRAAHNDYIITTLYDDRNKGDDEWLINL